MRLLETKNRIACQTVAKFRFMSKNISCTAQNSRRSDARQRSGRSADTERLRLIRAFEERRTIWRRQRSSSSEEELRASAFCAISPCAASTCCCSKRRISSTARVRATTVFCTAADATPSKIRRLPRSASRRTRYSERSASRASSRSAACSCVSTRTMRTSRRAGSRAVGRAASRRAL